VLPAADWKTWLLENVAWAALDVVRAIWLPSELQDVDVAELETVCAQEEADRDRRTAYVGLPQPRSSAPRPVMVSGQRHSRGLKKPPRLLESRVSEELPTEAYAERRSRSQ